MEVIMEVEVLSAMLSVFEEKIDLKGEDRWIPHV
jgi:hypothetical protein